MIIIFTEPNVHITRTVCYPCQKKSTVTNLKIKVPKTFQINWEDSANMALHKQWQMCNPQVK